MSYFQVYGGATAEGETYVGSYDDCVVEYDKLSSTLQQLVNATYQAIRDNGGTPLTLRVWCDSGRNRWKTEATAHFGGVASASLTPAFALPPLWVLIVGAIITIVVVGFIAGMVVWMTGSVGDMLSFLEPVFDEEGNLIYPSPILTSIFTMIIPLVVLGVIGYIGFKFLVPKISPPKPKEEIA